MSKKTIKQVKTGIFIFVGIFLCVLFTLVVGNNQNMFYSTIKYKARFDNAQGLFVGSIVTVNGIRAGNISAIEFEDNNIIVIFGMRKNYAQYVNQSSVAYVRTRGIVGDKYIAIHTKKTGPPLSEGSFIPSPMSNNVMGIFSEQGELALSVASFFKEAGVFLARVNSQEKERHFLSELNKISSQTQKFLSNDKNKDLKEILTYTKNILKKIDQGQGTLGALVNDRSLHNKALSFLGEKPYKKILKSFFPWKKETVPNIDPIDEF